jgi:putative phosphoribosyl transferase
VEIAAPKQPIGMIIFPATIPLNALPPGLRLIAAGLRERGFATLFSELLSPAEVEHGYHHFDFEMLADRIADITDGLRYREALKGLPIGYLGTSTDAAAMAVAAARSDCPAGALVMCDARPELASTELHRIRAPTLFIVEEDELALDLNRNALARLGAQGELAILHGTGNNLASPETASQAAELAGKWFEKHLACHQDGRAYGVSAEGYKPGAQRPCSWEDDII